MLLHVALFMLWFTTNPLSMPLHKSIHHPKHFNRTSRKLLTRRSPSPPNLDRSAALAAQAATLRKFRNAPAILAGQHTYPNYAIPSSLQNTYDRASDYATNVALLSSQLKSSADPPSNPSSAVKVACVPLSDETDGVNDYEFYGPMEFGSQRQPLQMDFDTGSADLWVPVNCSDCNQLTQFQANASSTYHNTSQTFADVYGYGMVRGTRAADTVTLGPYTVLNQSFGAVDSASENFADSPNDGIAGLAFSALSNLSYPTLFENLIPQLQAPLFSVYMTRTQVHGAEICFGGIDVSKARETTISWVPVVLKTWWTVEMNGVLVNNMRVPTSNTTGPLYAVIDTGTSFIYFPDDDVNSIYLLIPGSVPAPDYGDGFWAYPCDAQIVVSFVLGSQTFTMDSRDMNLGQYPGDPTGSKCIGAIISGGDRSIFNIVILGDSFLKSYVSVFDYAHGARVGFVKSISE